MWLVLCDPADQPALWAYQGLRERGLEPLELLSAQALLGSTRTAHRVDPDGASFELVLPDGRVLASRDVEGVLNRVACAPFGYLPFDTHADAVYAAEELHALLLSLLTCLAPVSVNPPVGYGLCGAWRSDPEWTALAARAGLPVPPAVISSDPDTAPRAAPPPPDPSGRRDVLVLGEQIFGAPVPGDEEGYVRLARLAEADLLGIALQHDGRRPAAFAGATPMPDLRLGGDAFLDHLLKHLTGLRSDPP
ncbi:hypothetical protein [Streptomyces sp. CBMA123]|uniref:hypothetical protein n=1 Tax=Streptomyces sp. CBMA123 TaxID=1896313 RepID=UPI001661A179|nr:hypothetical protein [Streptomyces sp. CBMA123]MBD0692922.1 hypothetical protein [Streptomyces sp. CBMA123]